ncbi:SDR family NAD(P)-dependent oxidoreductase [Hyalangium rubrum]|uniref:SDR family oxidoreductase n=1 Tax=Hyalangium rubrum TaxID=3103134 RepID=A0ABU5GZG7_9BACT|nr:SDR family oxidoreductase [Hyalangium sp. s54d21]MDY7225928.1 SDR family oxidoreductase [Hyalangium sp. s54d21]
MTTQTKKKTALITGASGGIGLDFARLFAEGGYDVVLVARTESKLQELAQELSAKHGVRALVVASDLSDPAAPARLMERLKVEGVQVDALVNNAGYGAYGAFVETDLDAELKMIQLNISALTALTKAVLPGMLERKSGRILNVASTAAFQPGPLMAVYYATKAYVLSFSEALANETRGTGVTVTCLCPGPTKTGFQQQAKMEESRLVKGKEIMDSLTVARAGYEALHRGQAVVIPGFVNNLLAQSVRFLPRSAVTTIVRKVQERAHA